MLKRECSREKLFTSQPTRFQLARDKKASRLREICVESNSHFAISTRFPIRPSKIWRMKLTRLSEINSLKQDLCREQFPIRFPARLSEIQQLQGIRSTWHGFIGQNGILGSSLKRDFTDLAHINSFLFSFQISLLFYSFSLHFRERNRAFLESKCNSRLFYFIFGRV